MAWLRHMLTMITSKDINIYQRAISNLTQNFNRRKYSIVAIIPLSRKFQIIGRNSYSKTHPMSEQSPLFVLTMHAEINALSQLMKKGSYDNYLTMYIFGVGKTGKVLKDSKPCHRCMSIIKRFGIKRLVFTSDFELTDYYFN